MGIRIPDEILENIRQYIGNCRICNREFIMTLDKKSKEFMNIEYIIKKKLDKMCYTQLFYNKAFTWTEGFNLLFGLNLPTYKDGNWGMFSLWRQDTHNIGYRLITYKYYADTNTLIFQYKKHDLIKNIDIEYIIP